MLMQGATRIGPPPGSSQAHPGVHPLSAFTHRTQKFQPLPMPLGDPPYHYDLEAAIPGIGQQATQNGSITFHVAGDTGGIKHPEYQTGVADAMAADLSLPAGQAPSFFYHVGDVVYYNGELTSYYSQFYEPYQRYPAPILAIPGNHDGDPVDASQTSLDGWVAYFMQATPHVDPASHDAPRVTMSLPNVYWTLNCPFLTVVGMYTNVPDHGSIDSQQQQWLTHELATAPVDKALIVALHHPIYSFDAFHSGSPLMADALQHAINDSSRVPNMVLTGHVHNYQRIERTVLGGTVTPFLVAGHGGYYHMHTLTAANGDTDPNTGANLIFGDDKRHGYVTLKVDAANISGTATATDPAGAGPTPNIDTFSYPTAAQFLPAGVTISL